MASILSILALSQVAPGPLDAFRLNYASLKVEMDFKVTHGVFIDNRRLWDGVIPHYVERHERDTDATIVGHWACDGTAEYFRFGSPDEVLERARNYQVADAEGAAVNPVWFLEHTEALWNGELIVWHYKDLHFENNDADLNWRIVRARVADDEAAACLGKGRGPLNWGTIFPHVVAYYGATAPARRRVLRWGHPTEVEIYQKDQPDGAGWARLEVSYDPAVGYLPRFVRTLIYDAARDRARSDEMYLTDARVCAGGGFAPLEWYNIRFEIPRFKSQFPTYSEATDLAPALPKVDASRFEASNFRDFSGPVGLTDIKDVHSIAAIGGVVIRPALTRTLTYGDVKVLTGRTTVAPVRRITPGIEEGVLHTTDRPDSKPRWPYIIGLAATILLVSWAPRPLRGRLCRRAAGLIIFGAISGCGRVAHPVIMLSAAYKDSVVCIEPHMRELPMTLVVRNDGNQPLRLQRAECASTCYQIDQSSLPVTVMPGKLTSIGVVLSVPTARTLFQTSQFHFQTDNGRIPATVPLYILARHELIGGPLVNNNMYKCDEWNIDLTHRVIFPAADCEPEFNLGFPSEFAVARGSSREGRIWGTQAYSYREVDYRLTLHDRTIGIHKRSIVATDSSGAALVEAPVLWKRVPFLSLVPEQIVLGTQPVRVYLRCPDSGVELTGILDVPLGVKAIVSSRSEILVMPRGGPADTCGGTIAVATTAEDHPPLLVRVARFRPTPVNEMTAWRASGDERAVSCERLRLLSTPAHVAGYRQP